VKVGYNLLTTLLRLERGFDYVDINSTSIEGCGSGGGGRGSTNKIGVPSSNLIILYSNSGCLSPCLYGEGDGGSGLTLMNEVSLLLRCLARQQIWFSRSKGGTVNTSRALYRAVVRPGSYCQNAVLVTNSVVSTTNNGTEGGLVRRRRYTPALGGGERRMCS